MKATAISTVVLVGWLFTSNALQAHHSLAGVYEIRKESTVTGELTKIAFTNPHGAMHLKVKDDNGATTEWVMTTGSANVLANLGFGENGANHVKAGDTVTITYFPARNGKPLGFIRRITLPNSNQVEFEAL
jgi:DNA/RNA endonuclease YhcR with UshA esterase domain